MGGEGSEGDEEKERAAILLRLRQANGIKDEDLKHPERLKHFEMVLDDYPCMAALKYFVNLRSICLIQQAIAKIDGLENCQHLESLLLNENALERVEGLSQCGSLKKLYLCSNAIRELGAGLEGLDKLERLWVNDNALTSLEGIGLAGSLTELSAARNQLSSVVGVFSKSSQLKSINLADNCIGSFRQVPDLARLSSLRELSFSDPDWGQNPICQLCNYQTYMLYHLPGLDVLDKMKVGDEERQAALAAFAKKQLYYNMRLKLVRRYAGDSLRAARALDEKHGAGPSQDLEATARLVKRIDAFARMQEQNPAEAQLKEPDASANLDRSSLEGQLAERQAELADSAALLQAFTQHLEAEENRLVRGLLLELQTGGNVRLEQGVRERDAWMASIEDLVRTRFNATDFITFGIGSVRVASITQVQNRSLQLRFSEALEQRAEGEARRELEYLFYVPDPAHALADIGAVVEQGVGYTGSAGAAGTSKPAVVLTNSVSVADGARLKRLANAGVAEAVDRALRRAQERSQIPAGVATGGFSGSTPVVCGGTLLVCSAYLPNQKVDEPSSLDSSLGVDARTIWAPPKQLAGEVGSTTEDDVTLYRSKAVDPKQKAWRVPLHQLVLPEYVVEFDYVFKSEFLQSMIAARQPEYGPFGGVFRDFAFHSQLFSVGRPQEEAGRPNSAAAADHQLADLPVLEKLTELESLAPESLPAEVDPSAWGTLLVLNLHGRGLRRVEPAALQALTSLQTLLASFNSIETISWISGAAITHVDVSFNLVHSISALPGLPALRCLDLAWNSLHSLDVFATLMRDVGSLEVLALAGNPVAKTPGYRAAALCAMRSLKCMDNLQVTPKELAAAQEGESLGPLGEAAMKARCYAPADSKCSPGAPDRPLAFCSPTDWQCDASTIASLLGRGDSGVTTSNWRNHAQACDLRSCRLTDLEGVDLNGFNQLRRIDLSRNQLSTIEKISQCTQLQELCIEQNALTALEGVEALAELQRLDAGSNQINDAHAVQKCSKLTQLSLEDNNIDSLDTFSQLHSLMELYLSGNLLEDLRSILQLKGLTKLVVLDLSGNDLCKTQDYRKYTIFHLKRLKVLDGLPVSTTEQQEAEELFSRRVTMELIEEKLGPAPMCYQCRAVDLSNLNLRGLGVLLNDEMFPAMRELNLEGNPFTDIRTVGPLQRLVVLRINRSKIDLDKGLLGEGEGCGGIGSMPKLQVLEMGSCGISDLKPLGNLDLSTLKILHLPGNDIARVEGLSQMANLRELVLDNNKIKQFDEASFEGLSSLRELRAENSGLKSLSNLAPLPRLRSLYLSLNRVGEFSELEKLRGLKQLALIHLSQNPMARKPLYRTHVINNLRGIRSIDGKEVTDEEREKVEQILQMNDASKLMGQGIYVLADGQTPSQAITAAISQGGDLGRHVASIVTLQERGGGQVGRGSAATSQPPPHGVGAGEGRSLISRAQSLPRHPDRGAGVPPVTNIVGPPPIGPRGMVGGGR